jgi:hypothetical protein
VQFLSKKDSAEYIWCTSSEIVAEAGIRTLGAPQYPLYRRINGAQRHSGNGNEDEYSYRNGTLAITPLRYNISFFPFRNIYSSKNDLKFYIIESTV